MLTDEQRARLQHCLDHHNRNGSVCQTHVAIPISDLRSILAVAAPTPVAGTGAINVDDNLKSTDGPLLELDVLLAAFHKAIWDDYERGHDFDEAGVPECKAIQRHVRAMLAASKSVSLVMEMTDERVRRAFYLANCRAWYDLKPPAARGVAREIILAASAAPAEGRDSEQQFAEWFAANYPGPDTIIHDPHWHAPRILRAARAALATAPTMSEAARGDLQAEIDRLNAIINTPQADYFLRSVSIEAEHQRQRWPSECDAGKTPADWFWLVGYLRGKALHAHAAGNIEKAEHHVITTAAACANWHRAMFGKTNMRPGIDGDAIERIDRAARAPRYGRSSRRVTAKP